MSFNEFGVEGNQRKHINRNNEKNPNGYILWLIPYHFFQQSNDIGVTIILEIESYPFRVGMILKMLRPTPLLSQARLK